ncbi:hypothetical protein MCGE09_00263 [Thaumarchaeota archaeon SCGC AB-539-E09]|nr:hypothetical protein MCGE09_00263 [Thaumarchaeota archaeon SCGC AB-539-E09]
MKLSDKFGLTAVKAVELYASGKAQTPKNAWQKAGYQILKKKYTLKNHAQNQLF